MTLGFVGAGNMAGAIIKGVAQSAVMKGSQLNVFDLDAGKVEQLACELGIVKADTCADLIAASDMIVMAVKPHQLQAVLRENKGVLPDKAVISIAAGWSMDMLRAELPEGARVLHVMPNTPALVGCGMTAFSMDTNLTDAERAQAERVFGALGRVAWVEEHQMKAVTGLSGSGPAYAYMFIEAMADGGVYQGLTRPQALEMAAQTLMGAAKMALESGLHPGALKDMVCSPGGTTIAAVKSLEKAGFRGAVMEAVCASSEKALEIKK